jgi:TrmH family RNA methyltransferase
VAATVHSQTSYLDLNYQKPLCLVLGAEGQGLPPQVEQMVDIRAKIDYPGQAESLNVAVSGAVFLFEILRQRRKPFKNSGIPAE